MKAKACRLKCKHNDRTERTVRKTDDDRFFKFAFSLSSWVVSYLHLVHPHLTRQQNFSNTGREFLMSLQASLALNEPVGDERAKIFFLQPANDANFFGSFSIVSAFYRYGVEVDCKLLST